MSRRLAPPTWQSEEERRTAYVQYVEFEQRLMGEYSYAGMKSIALDLLMNVLGYKCRANADVDALIYMLLSALLRALKREVGRDAFYAEVLTRLEQ